MKLLIANLSGILVIAGAVAAWHYWQMSELLAVMLGFVGAMLLSAPTGSKK